MTLIHGDCREVMATLDASSIDSIVTDPPYGLSFMGKGWDHGVPGVEFWTESLRVAKPGAHLLAFGGTRTHHRLACAIEDAGWEIRDCVMWVYGSGFPKSLDVSKAIDKAAAAEREVIGSKITGRARGDDNWRDGSASDQETIPVTAPATDNARKWNGWGTALKPAWEPIIVARKPLCGTVAENVLTHGTGAINVDGCRVEMGSEYDASKMQRQQNCQGVVPFWTQRLIGKVIPTYKAGGRWPANLIHDGSEEVMGLFPETKSGSGDVSDKSRANGDWGMSGGARLIGDSGSAARFFYCAKARKADRDEGCDELPSKQIGFYAQDEWSRQNMNLCTAQVARQNTHPTVKPTALMRYLCRLVTPPNGIVLDPFCGSGSTGKAATLEGFRFVGIEREAEYVEIARARIAAVEGMR